MLLAADSEEVVTLALCARANDARNRVKYTSIVFMLCEGRVLCMGC